MLDPSVLIDMGVENTRQLEKHGPGAATNQDAVWNMILTEEVGEVAKEALTRCWSTFATSPDVTKRLYDELIQVATVAAAWATQLKEENPGVC